MELSGHCNDSVPKMDNGTPSKNSMASLFSSSDKVDYALMFFGTLGSCVHGAGLPVFFVLFGRMIDSLGHLSNNPHRLSSRVSENALYLIYLGLIVMVSSWIGVASWMQTGERQTARLRVKYLESILKKDISFFDTEARESNLIFHISSDAVLVQDAIGDQTGHALRYLSQFVVGFAVGFASVWKLTLVTLAVVPLIAVAGVAYTVVMSTFTERSEAAYAEAGNVAEEAISQIRTVYSFVGENRAIEEYSKSLNKALEYGKKGGLAKGIGVGFTYGLLFCAWSLLLWYSGILVRHGDTNGGKAFTTVINVIFSGFALGQAAPSLAAIAKGRVAAGKILSMIQKTNDESLDKSGNRKVLPTVSGAIEFCGVSFAYPSRPDMVFENLSLELASGKTFAVVGPSGSGKSTIISMVQRFYEPTSGKILLDGHDLKFLNLKWLREQMGMVSQEPALFGTTIFENILLGKQDSDMNQIVEAAKAANAHSFIETLPNGYYTQVGEGGTRLSGGQKQRIAIARAVLRNPKILLLDEATSALDAESESIVQQALDRVMSNRTTIVVAHRLSTIRDVDMIIVLKKGQVVETGTHSELSTINGEYANLVNLQVSKQAEISGISSHSQSSVSSSIRELNDIAITASKYEQYDPQKLPRQSSDQTPSIWELVKLNAPEWPYAILGSIGAIAAGILAPMFSLGITHVLDAFYSFNDAKIKHEVERVALIFVALAVATIPVYLFQHYIYTLMGEKLTSRIRLLMFSAILCNEVGWFDLEENSIGSLTSILAADATLVRSSLADRLSTLVQNAALTISAFVVAFVLSWRIAAVVMASFPLLIGASIAEQLFMKGFGGDYTKSYAKATSVAREAIANIRTVAAFGAEDRVSAQFASQLDQPGKNAFLRGHIAGFGYGLSNLLAFCSYALGLWYASILIKENESRFGDIMKSFMVLIVTALGIAETLALTPDIVKGSQALGSVFRILKRKTIIDPDCSSSNTITHVRGDIEFKNVKFSYPSRPDIIVLDSLNLNVPDGKSLAVVGPSGSGKSTVIGLAMRFYDPNSGQVLLDGQDIKTLNLRSLRKRIGLVQQEPALFATTIYENIKYGNEEASEIEVLRAARAANADNFISQMPDRYNTQVGERGVQLSGGQKQRVAIARAILKDPAILLLDEATSALDAESERAVREALSALMEWRTTVVVAHRLSTIRNADTIVVLQSGNVVEMGNHEELVGKAGGVYKQLVSLQQHADSNQRT